MKAGRCSGEVRDCERNLPSVALQWIIRTKANAHGRLDDTWWVSLHEAGAFLTIPRKAVATLGRSVGEEDGATSWRLTGRRPAIVSGD